MSRVNHNAQYIYDFEGETVWEKLRAIRGQLEQRKISLELAKLDHNAEIDKDSVMYKKYLITKTHTESIMQDCINEIAFLTEFEAALTVEAEKTRIPGKTDDEMYEINFFDELKIRLVKSAQAQILSCGRLSEDTIKRILKNKGALLMCIEQGLLSENALQIADKNLLPTAKEYKILNLEKGN